MYDLSTRSRALALIARGRSLNSVSRQTGISRAAIRSWQHRLEPLPRMAPPDPGPPADERAYAHLLGLYLGDVSAGIRRLHTDTLDKLGVEWRPCTRNGSPFDVSVARQASVALMDTHVGPTF